MRWHLLVLLSVAAGGASGCDATPATPFSPSPALASGPADARPVDSWRLTKTLTSVAGPLLCFDGRGRLGAQVARRLDVDRRGDTITLAYDVRDTSADHLELVGTLRDDRFEAATSRVGSRRCGASRVDYHFESYVSGTIAADGQSMIASERWTYRLSPDEHVVLWFAWEAQRQ